AGQDGDHREVLFVRIGDEHMTQRDAQVLAQQTLCGLDSVAKSIGWTKPHVRKNMFRMSVVVDSSQLSMANWLTCAKCMLAVIKAIQPFVSPFYDRMPGLISVVDPPFVATKAWYMVRPWLGQPTREVVRFVQSEQPESD
ncbi:CRAL-TRIO domain-containing protein, partial [Durusdinium trenchii]